MLIQAAILAGGRGERMRPVTAEPKALLSVRGKPLLEHQLGWLKSAGFDEVILCLGYRAERVRETFGDGSRWGMRIDYRIEAVPRGTAGAVRDLGEAVRGDLLIVYGDLYVEMPCRPLLDFHAGHDAAATLVVRHTDHPEDSDLVEVADDGRIRAIGRRGSGKVSGEVACGAIWVIRRRMLERVPQDAPSDFARDIFPKAVAEGETLMAYRIEKGVADIGTPERYEAFRKRLSAP
ncbi:MAG: sugar phosphate nucleotidyltransferase [Elusimicrobiota bacterium]